MFYVEVNGKLSIQIEIYSLLGKVCLPNMALYVALGGDTD